MTSASGFAWQASLLDTAGPAVDTSFAGLVHHRLDDTAWVDHVPGWLSGSDEVFDRLLATVDWQGRDRPMYGRIVTQPRLTTHWPAVTEQPLPPLLEEIRRALVDRYGRPFDAVGANLYRDGRDSVAWHADRIPISIADPLVATVSLGHTRRFLLRPKGGGASVRLDPGKGDLIVMGGSSQRTWEHTVPKVAFAGPRISITVRHST